MVSRYDVVMRVTIRPATPGDLAELAAMCHRLWPDATLEEHSHELAALLAPGSLPATIFVAENDAGKLIGFVETRLRSHADGCDPKQPVGFIDGWYVAPDSRRQKIGTQLVAAAEAWAREQGCVEMASDTWIDQIDSQHAHQALGFEVVDRCVRYCKNL